MRRAILLLVLMAGPVYGQSNYALQLQVPQAGQLLHGGVQFFPCFNCGGIGSGPCFTNSAFGFYVRSNSVCIGTNNVEALCFTNAAFGFYVGSNGVCIGTNYTAGGTNIYYVTNSETNFTTNVYCGPVSECIDCTNTVTNVSQTNNITENITNVYYVTSVTNEYITYGGTQEFFNTSITNVYLGIVNITTNITENFYLATSYTTNIINTGSMTYNIYEGIDSLTNNNISTSAGSLSNATLVILTNAGSAAMYYISFGGGTFTWVFNLDASSLPLDTLEFHTSGSLDYQTATVMLKSNEVLYLFGSGGGGNKILGWTRQPFIGN